MKLFWFLLVAALLACLATAVPGHAGGGREDAYIPNQVVCQLIYDAMGAGYDDGYTNRPYQISLKKIQETDEYTRRINIGLASFYDEKYKFGMAHKITGFEKFTGFSRRKLLTDDLPVKCQ